MDALDNAPNGRFTEERTCFYVAEIALALEHIHRMGMIYRDLKPQNVLLNADGHIKLIDMGAVIDVKQQALRAEAKADMSLFRYESSVCEESSNAFRVNDSSWPKAPYGISVERSTSTTLRARSIIGTYGYMAPEILMMKHDEFAARQGYTYAVDWWSLGILTAKLLTGHTPFGNLDVSKFVLYLRQCSEARNVRAQPTAPEYTLFFDKLKESGAVSDAAMDFVSGLLVLVDDQRLGSGILGSSALFDHSFFTGTDWNQLEDKQVEPPFLSPSREIRETPVYSNFEELIASCFRAHWKYSIPDTFAAKKFKNWSVNCNIVFANRFSHLCMCAIGLHRNYISRSALQQEIRVENASFAESRRLPPPRSPSSLITTCSLDIFASASSIRIDEVSQMNIQKPAVDRKIR